MPFTYQGIAALGERRALLYAAVLLSYLRNIQDSGKPASEAVFEGAQIRYQPVMLTSLAASLGFIPTALSQGMGTDGQRPLATVVIGGLVTFNDKAASDRGRKEKNVRTVGTQGNDRRRSSRMPHRTRDLRRLWGQRAVPKSRRFFLFPQFVGQFESRTDFCEFPSHRKGSSYGERFFSFRFKLGVKRASSSLSQNQKGRGEVSRK